jgi:hypothetical protein
MKRWSLKKTILPEEHWEYSLPNKQFSIAGEIV